MRKPFSSAEPPCQFSAVCTAGVGRQDGDRPMHDPPIQSCTLTGFGGHPKVTSATPMQPQTAPFSEITSNSSILEHAELMFKRFSTEMPSEHAAGAATSHQIPGANGNVGSRAEESVRGVRTVNSGIRGRIAVRKRFRNRRGPLSTRISEPAILKRQQGPVATLPGRLTGRGCLPRASPLQSTCPAGVLHHAIVRN